ncbi:MAG: lysophospholipase [Undibacterium sp.]|nr:lysophospholipase [Undibacterium sp.]
MNAQLNHIQEFFLNTSDKTAIFVRDWPALSSHAPGILLMHGLGEHSGRYLHVARFFQSLGFRVRSFDHRGHGQSQGPRGDVPDTTTLLNDIQLVIKDFSTQLMSPPLIFAHSMGGLFSCRVALEGLVAIKGLILSSPALSVKTSGFQKFIFAIARHITPHLAVTHGTNGRYLSHDQKVVRDYQTDPLVHSRISACLFQSMLNTMAYVKKNCHNLQVPLLVLVAGDDLVVNPSGAKAFVEKLSESGHTTKVKSIIYPGFYHEIFNEKEAAIVFDDVQKWLKDQNLLPDKPSI